MAISRKAFSDLAEIILGLGARQATKYFSEKQVVTATRRLYGGKIDKRDRSVEILFKVGSPNCREREFIKKCKKAGEPFPIKNIQIKWLKGK